MGAKQPALPTEELWQLRSGTRTLVGRLRSLLLGRQLTFKLTHYGSPIRTAAGGTVLYAGWHFAYGKIVDIRHADGPITRYAHMSAFAPGIASGASVAEGAVIGQVGTTGRAHGAHVHFEVRVDGHPVDPKPP